MTAPDTSTPEPASAGAANAAVGRAREGFGARVGRIWGWVGGYFAKFPTRRDFWIVFALLFAAGLFLRFWRLGYQSYWTDESHTIYRIFGDYARMLKRLDDQGFPPGWYTALRAFAGFQEWRLGSGAAAFAPESLRILPAILGTLTVPAMYFLARQFTDRRGSLLVMLLAAVNPFLIYYSRDIKMYAALWLFATLNMALFFQWQSSKSWRQAIWFPLYVITGCLATAMHGMAWFPIALQLIFLLTRPRPRPLDAPLWVVGLLFVSLLPIWWYDNGTKWLDNAVEGTRTGLEWNANYTDMNWRTIVSLPSSHVLGVLWPEEPPTPKTIGWFHMDPGMARHMDTRAWHWLTMLEFWAILVLFAVLIIGLFPWRGRREDSERAESATRGRWWWLALWIILPSAGLALTWLTPTGHVSVTSTAAVADRKAPLDGAGLGRKIVSGTFEVRCADISSRRGFLGKVTVKTDGSAGGTTLDQLAGAIRAAGREMPPRGDPSPPRDRLAVSVTSGGQLQIKALDDCVFTFHGDTSGVLGALGIQPVPPVNSWYQLVWGWKSKPPTRVWEPRYLGIIVPAMLLWLAAALRRMPSAPLRAVLVCAAVGACTFSALSNHLIYRNTPYEQVAETVLRYRQKNPNGELPDAKRVAWNNPRGQALRLQDLFTLQIRGGIRPWATQRSGDPPAGAFFVPLYHEAPSRRPGQTRRVPDTLFWEYRDVSELYPPDDGYENVQGYLSFLNEARNTANVAAIVLTDRQGDLPDTMRRADGTTAPHRISNEAIGKLLGPEWRLDFETRYRWHYEWHFNFFHTWRTRVWVRAVPASAPAPATTTKP